MVNLDMSKYEILTLDEVDSTNSYSIRKMSSLNDGSVVFSPHQSLGRGRYNRKWLSDETENLYVSFVFKPIDVKNYPFANLTQYLSVVVCKFLKEEFDIEASIKWPNDILVDGYKISGILAESYMEDNQIKGVVLGFGLNVNLKDETLKKIDQKATSLSVLKNDNFDVEILLKKLCDMFFENYDEFVKKGFEYIKDDYISKCDFLGKQIKIREVTGTKEYIAKAIADDGLLVVIDKNNNECKIITGDVLC